MLPSTNLSLTQNALKAKIDNAQPQNKDSAAAQKRQKIDAELAAIRQEQSVHKTGRAETHEKIKATDAQIKTYVAELRTSKSRIPFKNVEELDQEVKRLTSMVDSGTMRIVDETKALEMVYSL